MSQTYKILGQSFVTPNTLTNVYVTGASTSAVINSIYICNQEQFRSNVSIILRPIDEPFANKHVIIRDESVEGAASFVLNLGITMGPNTILAANTNRTLQAEIDISGTSNISYGAFGLEIT